MDKLNEISQKHQFFQKIINDMRFHKISVNKLLNLI